MSMTIQQCLQVLSTAALLEAEPAMFATCSVPMLARALVAATRACDAVERRAAAAAAAVPTGQGALLARLLSGTTRTRTDPAAAATPEEARVSLLRLQDRARSVLGADVMHWLIQAHVSARLLPYIAHLSRSFGPGLRAAEVQAVRWYGMSASGGYYTLGGVCPPVPFLCRDLVAAIMRCKVRAAAAIDDKRLAARVAQGQADGNRALSVLMMHHFSAAEEQAHHGAAICERLWQEHVQAVEKSETELRRALARLYMQRLVAAYLPAIKARLWRPTGPLMQRRLRQLELETLRQGVV